MDFIRIPNLSPGFDAEWETNGTLLQVIFQRQTMDNFVFEVILIFFNTGSNILERMG